MKKILAFLLVILTTCVAFPQKKSVDSLVQKKIIKLKKKSIDTILVYKIYGEYMITPKCGHINTYLIWKKNNKVFISKSNKCKSSKSKLINDKTLFDFYFSNKINITKEEVKPFITQAGGYVGTSHYSKYSLIIHEKKEIRSWEINSFHLEQQSGEKINANFDFNNSLKLIELKKIVTEIIKEYQ